MEFQSKIHVTYHQLAYGETTAKERRWAFIFASLVMILTTLPYIIAYGHQGLDWRFTGFLFGVEDGNSYIAKMLLGESGEFFFRTPYSTFPQRGVLAFLPYLLLGKLVNAPGEHEQFVAIYHIFRVIAGILAIMASYDFIASFCCVIRYRRLGVILAVFGGGLGWILFVIGKTEWMNSLPLEFYSPESFGFLSLFGIPHLALARATFLWGFVEYINNGSEWYRKAIKLGVLWLITALAQPITAVVLGFVIGMHLIVTAGRILVACWNNPHQYNWDHWLDKAKTAGLAGVLPILLLGYTLITFATDPFLKLWTEQNIIHSPHPFHYLLAYGLILPLAILGAVRLLRIDKWRGSFLGIWLSLLPFLAYAPFNLQRRLPEGIWVALVTAGMVAFEEWNRSNHRSEISTKRKFVHPEMILIFAIPSTVVLVAGGLVSAFRPSTPVYRPAEEVKAFKYLAEQSEPGDVVLTSYDTGNALPAWAPVHVVIGHGPESVGLSELRMEVERVFKRATDPYSRNAIFEKFNVKFIFIGPLERALGKWEPKDMENMQQIYQDEHYEIYMIVSY